MKLLDYGTWYSLESEVSWRFGVNTGDTTLHKSMDEAVIFLCYEFLLKEKDWTNFYKFIKPNKRMRLYVDGRICDSWEIEVNKECLQVKSNWTEAVHNYHFDHLQYLCREKKRELQL